MLEYALHWRVSRLFRHLDLLSVFSGNRVLSSYVSPQKVYFGGLCYYPHSTHEARETRYGGNYGVHRLNNWFGIGALRDLMVAIFIAKLKEVLCFQPSHGRYTVTLKARGEGGGQEDKKCNSYRK